MDVMLEMELSCNHKTTKKRARDLQDLDSGIFEPVTTYLPAFSLARKIKFPVIFKPLGFFFGRSGGGLAGSVM